MKFGYDISHHNGYADFSKLDRDFVIIRAGYGSSAEQADKRFVETVTNAKKNGVPFGVYWYSYAKTPKTAEAEAAAFHAVISKHVTRDTPVFLDIEDQSIAGYAISRRLAIANAFTKVLTNLGYKKVGVYSSDSWWLEGLSRVKADIKWVARWQDRTPQSPYDIWQNGVKVCTSGFINGRADVDQCSDEAFYNIFIMAEYAPPFNEYDVDHDGKVTSHDALTILQDIVKGSD